MIRRWMSQSRRSADRARKDRLVRDAEIEAVVADVGVDAPDLTDPIMSRLGYRRVSEHASRVSRRRRTFGRTATVLAMLGAIGAGVYLHSISDRARRPDGLSIPEALSVDFSRPSEAVGGVLNVSRDLFAPAGIDADLRIAPDAGRVIEPAEDADGQSPVPWSGLL